MISTAILTVSDACAAGARSDLSGAALAARVQEAGWTVAEAAIVPDDESEIAEKLRVWSDAGYALILTTGGTGLGPRDVTPEATRRVIEKEIPGIAELIRLCGLGQTPMAALSRSVVGQRKKSLIVNLPGSPKGALFSLQSIEALIPHAIDLLQGKTEHSDA